MRAPARWERLLAWVVVVLLVLGVIDFLTGAFGRSEGLISLLLTP